MNRRELYRILSVGDELAAADITALGLASIPAALSYTTLKQVPGGTKRARVTFGKDPNNIGTTSYDSFAITKGSGSTGSSIATGEFLDFPQGVIVIHAVLANLTISTTITTPTTPIIGIGTAAASSAAATTLATTASNIVVATALTGLTSTQTETFNVTPLKAGGTVTGGTNGAGATIADGTGGTYGSTYSATAGAATFTPTVSNAINNNFATIAGILNNTHTPLVFDGTTTAVKLFLNFACNSDPGTSKVIKAAGTIDVLWSNLGDV